MVRDEAELHARGLGQGLGLRVQESPRYEAAQSLSHRDWQELAVFLRGAGDPGPIDGGMHPVLSAETISRSDQSNSSR